MKQLYDTTKKLAGKYSKPERPVKDKEGKPITEIQQQRNRWVEYFEELLNRPASMNPPDIEAAHTDLSIDVNPDKKKYVEELATTAEKAAREGNMKQLHDTTKKLSGKYSKPERPVKDKEGKPITEIQQQRNRWVEYFEELLNRPASMNPPDIEAAHTDLSIDVNPLTKEEIRMAVR
ncbi:unnamed protein product [Schistosoma margrebowiei]|uniref:Uncharacterized protein n=1 Tax=Schistosoma margrebowiei TaxID=48269 RepID=A0A183N934_9TREM|nr:unnamed protein product [Schistosoma margrebowiei]